MHLDSIHMISLFMLKKKKKKFGRTLVEGNLNKLNAKVECAFC